MIPVAHARDERAESRQAVVGKRVSRHCPADLEFKHAPQVLQRRFHLRGLSVRGLKPPPRQEPGNPRGIVQVVSSATRAVPVALAAVDEIDERGFHDNSMSRLPPSCPGMLRHVDAAVLFEGHALGLKKLPLTVPPGCRPARPLAPAVVGRRHRDLDPTRLYDHVHPAQARDVPERIAVHSHEVRQFALLQRT